MTTIKNIAVEEQSRIDQMMLDLDFLTRANNVNDKSKELSSLLMIARSATKKRRVVEDELLTRHHNLFKEV